MNSKISIDNKEYIFSKNIKDNDKYRESFFELAKNIFEIDFSHWYENGFWSEKYIPYALIDNNKIVANVSVNKINIFYKGDEKLFIQIGTVMTDKDYRNRGLSKYLINIIIKEWQKNCENIYLYANDEVYDFYPKFNFMESFEYEYSKEIIKEDFCIKKLNLKNKDDFNLILDLYNYSNPYSDINMVDNIGLFMFHIENFLYDNIFYIEEFNCIVISEYDDEKLIIYDIFMKDNDDIKLDSIAEKIAAPDTKELVLGFTPKDREDFFINIFNEDGTKLFVHDKNENIFIKDKILFPMLSRA